MAFPQTFQNRTRTTACAELAEYVGGVTRADALARAGLSWDAAVREFNSVGWRFCIKSADITLVAGTQTYALNDFFRMPVRAKMLDSANAERATLTWFPYAEWLTYRPDQKTGSNQPCVYTAQNSHETGLVTFDPRPEGTLTYPKVRNFYAKFIELQPTAGSTLDVPPDVDEAIFQLALAKLIAKNKRHGGEAELAYKLAMSLRQDIERNYRIWGEPTVTGING